MTNRPATLEAYLDYLDRLPTKYRIDVSDRIPLWRKIWRWVSKYF